MKRKKKEGKRGFVLGSKYEDTMPKWEHSDSGRGSVKKKKRRLFYYF